MHKSFLLLACLLHILWTCQEKQIPNVSCDAFEAAFSVATRRLQTSPTARKLHSTLFSWRVNELFKILLAKQVDENKLN